jgi:uncharacterized membrane protein (DUF4010 family)
MDLEILMRMAVALAIGGLIGLERERSKGVALPSVEGTEAPKSREFAGIRTFPLIALAGVVAARLSIWVGPALFIAAYAAFTVLIAVAYQQIASRGDDQGITTAVTAIIVFGLGGLALFGQLELCGALGVTVYLLLALKPPLRTLARRVELEDIYALGKFGAITLLVLPLLPDQAYGPFQVLNPRKIWMLVILIAAVSLAGYLSVKALGPGRGFGLTGLLGGLISSTAVTLSFAQKSREYPKLALPSALAIVLACTTMVARIAVVTSLLNYRLLDHLWMPLAAMGLVGLAATLLLYLRSRSARIEEHAVGFRNPFELGPAIKFALAFAIVLVGAKALEHYLGNAGLYISGVAAGLTDVDAISLSMARLSADGQISLDAAVTTITLATMSNTLTKAGLALGLAGPRTRAWVFATLFAQALAGGAVIVALSLL